MKYAIAMVMVLLSGSAMAQANGTITNGTQSTAQQATNVNVNIGSGSGTGTSGVSNAQLTPTESTVGYTGSYTVKSAPTVYAPSLTASVTETCWGSVSAAVSVVGVGATGAATIKDQDCNRRLNAAVAWRMDRKDIAFNIMCQDESFRAAAAKTNSPCVDDAPKAAAATTAAPAATAAVATKPAPAPTAPATAPAATTAPAASASTAAQATAATAAEATTAAATTAAPTLTASLTAPSSLNSTSDAKADANLTPVSGDPNVYQYRVAETTHATAAH
ncbi:hypothetical protein [Paraburkholderia phosphatilytica]|uniref:hypothetical protein n=1 Tax=Paraburkholderia phosphatilytica TaxID=2282883 RepID=UPI0013DF9730|nr:hypothetical protein [Paraburkholderia phosphatilytica]